VKRWQSAQLASLILSGRLAARMMTRSSTESTVDLAASRAMEAGMVVEAQGRSRVRCALLH
jgi:hypothetical protein